MYDFLLQKTVNGDNGSVVPVAQRVVLKGFKAIRGLKQELKQMEEPVLGLLPQPSDATELNVQVIFISLAKLSERHL